jgi:hypothetical protein
LERKTWHAFMQLLIGSWGESPMANSEGA